MGNTLFLFIFEGGWVTAQIGKRDNKDLSELAWIVVIEAKLSWGLRRSRGRLYSVPDLGEAVGT